MADTYTTKLGLRKRAQSDIGAWAAIHNDSMDLIEEELCRTGTADPNVAEEGDYVGQLYVQWTTGDDKLPDIWICTTAGAGGVAVWKSCFNTVRRYLGGKSGIYTTITSAANHISWDLDDGNFFVHDMTENTTLDEPSNIPSAATVLVEVNQHAGTAYTLAFDAAIKWAGGVAPTIPTTLGARHLFTFTVDSDGALVGSILPSVS